MNIPAPARDVATLAARSAVGIVFLAHGWQKLFTNGIDTTTAFFDQIGVPAAPIAAWIAAIVELAGGAALIIGIAVPAAAVLLLIDMLGAIAFVHLGAGIFVEQGGYELALVLGASTLLLAVNGAGRISIDQLLTSHHHRPAHQPTA